MAETPGITWCFIERISNTGWPGLMNLGNFDFFFLPSVWTISTGSPTTPLSGCRIVKPVRLVRKSVSGVPVTLKVSTPLAEASIFAT